MSLICADILGVDQVGLDDDFYEIGGDSHQAVLLALEIERAFEVSLPLEVVELTANVRALATWIDEQHAQRKAGGAGDRSGG